MTEYFYTLDLGETYGEKLQLMAVHASFDDIEGFAAMILRHALDVMELERQIEIEMTKISIAKYEFQKSISGTGTDDDIPF
jgi:hypothetical protein